MQYMLRAMEGPGELWRMRKQFALQIAGTSFMTHVVCLTSRLPARFHISRRTGQIYMSELLPGKCTNALHMLVKPVFLIHRIRWHEPYLLFE
jgi:transformation/transcription domain-associated protein